MLSYAIRLGSLEHPHAKVERDVPSRPLGYPLFHIPFLWESFDIPNFQVLYLSRMSTFQ